MLMQSCSCSTYLEQMVVKFVHFMPQAADHAHACDHHSPLALSDGPIVDAASSLNAQVSVSLHRNATGAGVGHVMDLSKGQISLILPSNLRPSSDCSRLPFNDLQHDQQICLTLLLPGCKQFCSLLHRPCREGPAGMSVCMGRCPFSIGADLPGRLLDSDHSSYMRVCCQHNTIPLLM